MPGLAAGAGEFAALARRLTEAGTGGLRREAQTGISAAVRPVLGEIRAGLPDRMPDRYAEVLAADLQLRTSKFLGAAASVRVTAAARTARGGRRKLSRLDTGVLAHPRFGDRKHWFYQGPGNGEMVPGFFTGPLNHSAPQIRDAILAAMRQTAKKITKG